MTKILYVHGTMVQVDDENFVTVSQRKWHINAKGYVVSYDPVTKNSGILLHRVVMNAPKGVSIDHINHNVQDNRKANLRFCTRGQNIRNNRPFAKSGYKGVYPNFNKWNARIHHNGKSVFLGTHSTPELAAKAYNKAARYLFGEFAFINELEGVEV